MIEVFISYLIIMVFTNFAIDLGCKLIEVVKFKLRPKRK